MVKLALKWIFFHLSFLSRKSLIFFWSYLSIFLLKIALLNAKYRKSAGKMIFLMNFQTWFFIKIKKIKKFSKILQNVSNLTLTFIFSEIMKNNLKSFFIWIKNNKKFCPNYFYFLAGKINFLHFSHFSK